jgi:predicted dehydrogenase
MEKINVCIVGCGRVSTLQALGYQNNPLARIYAVCDTKEERAIRRAKEFGVKKIFTRYEDVLNDPQVDAIELLVPHNLHCQMAIQACEHKKHISVQKPMALSLAEANAMVDAADKSGVVFKICENYIWYPPFMKMKELIDAGEIGEPTAIRIKSNSGSFEGGWEVEEDSWKWRMSDAQCGGGTLIFDDGYHKFSLARYLLGDIEKVFAWIDKTDIIPDQYYIDAPAVISWKYKKPRLYGVMDAMYSGEMYMNTDYYACDERVEVTGSKGVVWVTRCTSKMLQIPTVILYKNGQTIAFEGIKDDWACSFVNATQDFIEGIAHGKPVSLNAHDAREVLKFSLAAAKSAKTGREVYLSEIE